MIIQPFLMTTTICVIYLVATSNAPKFDKYIACGGMIIACVFAILTGIFLD